MGKLFARVFSGVVLLLVGGVAFADTNIASTTAAAVTNHTDVSIAYLAQIFGTVGGVLHGTTGQMLGKMFYIFNQGILIVAGLWLSYSVVTIAFKSAQEGSFMGPNKNVAMVFIKIALGFGLLLPNPTTGYSVFQDVVMKVVVEGVSLADQTWNYGLNYINDGGTLWHRPEVGSAGALKALADKNVSDVSAGGSGIWSNTKQIFADEVCMVASSAQSALANSSNNSSGIVNTAAPATTYNYHIDTNNKRIVFSGLGAPDGMRNANCGYISWGNFKNISKTHESTNIAAARGAITQMIDALLPAARRTVCSMNTYSNTSTCNGIDTTDVNADNSEDFFTGIADYLSAIYPMAQNAKQGAAYLAKRFIGNAESAGWMTAGRYYWDLSQIQNHYLRVTNLTKYYSSDAEGANGNLSSKLSDAMQFQKGQVNGYISTAQSKMKKYSNTSDAGDTGGDYTSGARNAAHFGSNAALTALLTPIGSDIANLIALFSTHAGPYGMGPDPIMFLHNVGMACLSISGEIWFGLGIVIFGLLALTTVCQSSLNLSTPINGLTDWVKSPLMLLASLLFGIGIMLGFYLPLYPYMIFTFGVIGWLIAVIEAMVAAPLVCLGLTHPEGHDFLGQAQQALMLLLSVFIRPVLMVIGLIAGMILSYVSLRIIVFTYSGFLEDLFYNIAPVHSATSNSVLAGAAKVSVAIMAGGSVSDLLMPLLVFPLMLVIFAAIVYVVTTQCFSLITVLPDNILRWIGGPNTPSMAQQMAQEVKGASSQFGSSAGRAIEGGLSQGAGAAEKSQKEYFDKKGTVSEKNK